VLDTADAYEVKTMRMQNLVVNFPVATNWSRELGPYIWASRLFVVAIGACLMSSPVPAHGQAVDASPSTTSGVRAQAQLVVGGQSVKNNSKGILSVVGSSLQFDADGKKVAVEASSILDVSTDKDSRQDITGAAHLAAEAIPYGGSRVLSLFSHEVDVLTVEFRDANGAYHGAVFALAKGQAAPFKKQLVALGAKTTAPPAGPAPVNN